MNMQVKLRHSRKVNPPQAISKSLMYPQLMKEAFRESLIRHKQIYNYSTAQIARETGVPKTTLDALLQRKTIAPNVHDAVKIAAYFGKSVEEFESGETSKQDGRLRALVSRLSDEERIFLEAQLETLIARRAQ